MSPDRATGVDAAELVAVEYDPLPVVVGHGRGGEGRGHSLSRRWGRTSPAGRGRMDHDQNLFEGCDVVVSDTIVSQRMAGCPLEVRSAAAAGRRRRPRDRVALDAGAAPRSLRPHGHAGHGARSAARDRPGRRRRLRRQERVRRGGDTDRLARSSSRQARPLDGDAEREHDRAPARPRPAARAQARRDARRQAARLPDRHPGGRRCVPGCRRLSAEPDRAALERGVRNPAHRGRRASRSSRTRLP